MEILVVISFGDYKQTVLFLIHLICVISYYVEIDANICVKCRCVSMSVCVCVYMCECTSDLKIMHAQCVCPLQSL